MQYGFVIPGGDVHTIPQLAVEAEEAGWDGVFIPEWMERPYCHLLCKRREFRSGWLEHGRT